MPSAFLFPLVNSVFKTFQFFFLPSLSLIKISSITTCDKINRERFKARLEVSHSPSPPSAAAVAVASAMVVAIVAEAPVGGFELHWCLTRYLMD